MFIEIKVELEDGTMGTLSEKDLPIAIGSEKEVWFNSSFFIIGKIRKIITITEK